MTDITNKTKKPLRVPLPGGKTLFLVPGRSGQVAPKALDHPPLKALIDAGDIQVGGGSGNRSGGGAASRGLSGGQGHSPEGGIRHTGDR